MQFVCRRSAFYTIEHRFFKRAILSSSVEMLSRYISSFSFHCILHSRTICRMRAKMRFTACRRFCKTECGQTKAMPANNNIAVIERMMRVLENFQGERELSLTTLASRSKMVKSWVYRILFTLERLGYVEKNGDGQYSITGRFARLGGQTRPPSDLPALAQPFMHELVRSFQETVNLGVLDGDEVLY